MNLKPHQQRVVEERDALLIKLRGLREFIAGTTFPTVDRAERKRLLLQEAVMNEYADVLGERIAAFQ